MAESQATLSISSMASCFVDSLMNDEPFAASHQFPWLEQRHADTVLLSLL